MDDRARDLIAEIIAQLHQLYWSADRPDEKVGLKQIETLFERLKQFDTAGANRSRGSRLEGYRLPGIVTTDDEPSLRHQLSDAIQDAKSVRIASAFLSASDTNPLIRPLQELTRRGGNVRVLTSLMGFFNRPEALGAFLDWGEGLKIRLYHESPDRPEELLSGRSRGFHAKMILIEKTAPPHLMAVGSANLTGAGLETNVEWNYLSDFEVNVALGQKPSPYERAVSLFDSVWEKKGYVPDQAFLNEYSKLYERGRVLRGQLARLSRQTEGPTVEAPRLSPNPAQQDALKKLAQARQAGARRYAVIAATGIGKTMLSAFDVANVGAQRVLFLAHRRTILEHAAEDYRKVHGGEARQIILQGGESISLLEDEAVQVFAMVQTIGREENLSRIDAEFFDYIIVDEFHHAAAGTYARVLSHFKPRYLLGMTATPERTDGQDVLALCDREIAYEVRLLDAVDRGWLVPFQYYALHDPTDYEQVRWTGTGYDDKQLEELLSEDTRADLIVTNLRRYQPAAGNRKVLAFCSNVGHASWMARAFRARGLSAAAVTGKTEESERGDLIQRLQDEEDPLEILCAVDVLSEGVDTPSVSHILLLRPTHSFTVFLQQLGRGLRLHPGKSFVVVLDFVGNYKKSYVAPLALNGYHTVPERIGRAHLPEVFKPPKGCFVDADTEVSRIWRDELATIDPQRRKLAQIELALEEIADTERTLDDVRLPELFTFSVRKGEKGEGRDLAPVIRSLGGWLRVRHKLEIASEYERSLLDTSGETLLRHVEEELNPNKSYKMAVLRTLLSIAEDAQTSGSVGTSWSVAAIAPGFLSYYLPNRRRIADWPNLAREENPERYPLKNVVRHLKKMPLDKLSNTPEKPFVLDGDEFRLKEEYTPYWQRADFRASLAERVEYAEARYWYTH